MMDIDHKTAAGAVAVSTSGEPILFVSTYTNTSRFCTKHISFHLSVYVDTIADTAVPTASKPESSMSACSEVHILYYDNVSSYKALI
jgi:hypothetical protein